MTDVPTQETPTPKPSRIPPSMSGPIRPTFQPRDDQPAARLLLMTVRVLFITLLLTASLLPFIGTITEEPEYEITEFFGPVLSTISFGLIVLIVDWRTPNKRIGTVFAIYLGVAAGLVGAFAIGNLLELIADSWNLKEDARQLAYLTIAKTAIGITMCYIAVSVVLTTKDDFRLVIPYVEFARQVRGVRPILLDTSVLIDGRINQLGETGFVDAPFLLPEFVIEELQRLADSGDKLKRDRGRRGLSIVADLQQNPYIDLTIDAASVGSGSVDHQLLRLAGEENYRILTTDFNLEKVAQIQSVSVVNLNNISNALKAQVIPGDEVNLEIIRKGEAPDQGVGFLADGTMVVVVGAAEDIGNTVIAEVTNSLQTGAGRMVFADKKRIAPRREAAPVTPRSSADDMARSATQQPRTTDAPDKPRNSKSSRNPRR